jgi:DNA-directed RNA polymerase subunit alpha
MLNDVVKSKGVYYEEEGDYGRFEMAPLPKGFGTTLGNSIRRTVLLSSSGAAVVAARFEGIKHEFSGIPGIVEDVPTIILNLKKIRFRVNKPFQNVINVKLKFLGEKEVKAKDLDLPAGIEVVNGEQTIANLSDPTSQLLGEIYVAYGRGYMLEDETREVLAETLGNLEGIIYTDALFSPVVKANFYTESFLYGGKFDKEKLFVEIWTDGSKKPSEVFFEAIDILLDQFGALKNVLEKPIKPIRVLLPKEELEFKRRRLQDPIAAILKSELPSKLVKTLEKAGITIFGELLKYKPEDLKEEFKLSEDDVALIETAVKRLGFEMGRDYWKELEELKDEA